MKLGFASAIVTDLSLEDVVKTASVEGYDCIEVMCWPKGNVERRYAGITHIDVNELDDAKAEEIQTLFTSNHISISALGYYPNPLTPDEQEAATYVEHIKKVILASRKLGVNQVNTFIGRDWTKSVHDN